VYFAVETELAEGMQWVCRHQLETISEDVAGSEPLPVDCNDRDFSYCGELVGVLTYKGQDLLFLQLHASTLTSSSASTSALDSRIPWSSYTNIRDKFHPISDGYIATYLSDSFCLCAPHEITRHCLTAPSESRRESAHFGDPSQGVRRPVILVKMNSLMS
jgi:hypothetical protein